MDFKFFNFHLSKSISCPFFLKDQLRFVLYRKSAVVHKSVSSKINVKFKIKLKIKADLQDFLKFHIYF